MANNRLEVIIIVIRIFLKVKTGSKMFCEQQHFLKEKWGIVK